MSIILQKIKKKIERILQQIKKEEDEKNNIPNDKAGEKYAKKYILNQNYLDDIYGTDSFKLNYYYGNYYPDNNEISLCFFFKTNQYNSL